MRKLIVPNATSTDASGTSSAGVLSPGCYPALMLTALLLLAAAASAHPGCPFSSNSRHRHTASSGGRKLLQQAVTGSGSLEEAGACEKKVKRKLL